VPKNMQSLIACFFELPRKKIDYIFRDWQNAVGNLPTANCFLPTELNPLYICII